MKIQSSDPTRKSEKSKKSGKTQSAGGGFGVLLDSQEINNMPASSQALNVARVDALLAIQAAEDPTERAARGRMTARADRLLDELNALRMGLLSGNLTVGHVIDLADVVATHRENIKDPTLQLILDEIDLRAQIEIAKMRISLSEL